MNDISKETLEKMREENVQLKPRWYFLTKNYLFWLMFLLTTLLGGLSFGMIMFVANDLDWDIFHHLGIGLPKALLLSLPYLWVALLFLFLFATYYNFTHTRGGYRYQFLVIFLINLLVSILLGLALYQYGWTDTVDTQLRAIVPAYHHLIYDRENQWMQPEKGLLSGTIISLKPDNSSLSLRDHYNKLWDIDIRDANIRGMFPIGKNMEIRIIGQQLTRGSFRATEIRTGRSIPQRKRKMRNNL